MTPRQAIESLELTLDRTLKNQCACIADEIEQAIEQWEGLRRAGGQRDDHAAALLSRLRPGLAKLAKFASTCEAQIAEMVANPFAQES